MINSTDKVIGCFNCCNIKISAGFLLYLILYFVGLWNLCMDPPTPVDAATMRIPVGFGDYTYYIAIRCYKS